MFKYALYTQDQLIKEFSTSLTQGLSQAQVLKLREEYGPNELEEQASSWLSILMRQFSSPFIYLLFGAALVSFFLEDRINALIIFSIILINALLSFFQEYRAEQALKLLRVHLTMKANVLREGKKVTIDSKELVPGDIIFLNPGDYIPADARFIEGDVTVDESILTGESASVNKISTALEKEPADVYGASNLGFLATTLTSGSAKALIIATGSNTAFGAISHLTLQTARQSGFQERLAHLSKFILSVICITLVTLFVFHLILRGAQTDIIQLLLFSIALTLGLTPEALPTVTTFALSRGALQLAHHNVVVKRLSAIEDLGAITILCTDKTGTLTENKLTVAQVLEKDPHVLLYLLLASKKESSEPFDTALWLAAQDAVKEQAIPYERVHEIPFNPARLRNTVVVKKQSSFLLITRGAFEGIKKLCASLPDNIELQEWINQQALAGNRVLALAYKPISTPDNLGAQEKDLIFAGLVSFEDPIKATTAAAVAKAHKLGITIKMITGDSKEVACAVGQKVGLCKDVSCAISGTEFEALDLEQKQVAVHSHSVFSRILPEQKYEIVNLLKEGNVVGFLGEGINDAPALKTAHVALAVEGATDIAKDAADIILLRKSLMVIVEGIALGRGVFSNTIKYIVATLSSNFGNFYSVAIASLLIDFLPMLPIQILLVNLLSDMPMIAIATDTVDTDELRRPQAYNLRSIAFIATILGIVSSVFDFMFFSLFYRIGPSVLQTNWFILSILTELALIYSVRTKLPFFKARRPSFILMALSCIVAIVTVALPSTPWGQEFFHFQAPGTHNLLIIAAIVICYFVSTEAVKLFYVKWSNNAYTAGGQGRWRP